MIIKCPKCNSEVFKKNRHYTMDTFHLFWFLCECGTDVVIRSKDNEDMPHETSL